MRPGRTSIARFVFWLFFHVAALSVMLLGIAPAWWEAQGSWSHDLTTAVPQHAAQHARFMEAHLNEPFEGYSTTQVLQPQFGVVALSHMACGWMNLAQADPGYKARARQALGEITRRALDPRLSPYLKNPAEVKKFGDQNLYLSHLGVILGVHRHLAGESKHDELHTRIARHLRAESAEGGDWHARSYPLPANLKGRKGAHKWPADQAVTLTALYLYDQTHKASLSKAPIAGWLKVMKTRYGSQYEGLPVSALDDQVGYARHPRGCALSWTVLYMNQFAPKEAATLYAAYRKLYLTEVFGFGAFREWPPGISRGMDGDSGPVVLGVGVAATGLGIGAARLHKDARAYTTAMRAAATFGLPTTLAPTRRYVTAPLLGDAILFHGTTARRWFHKEAAASAELTDQPGAPWGLWIMMFLLSAFVLYSLMSVRENIQEIRWRRQ